VAKTKEKKKERLQSTRSVGFTTLYPGKEKGVVGKKNRRGKNGGIRDSHQEKEKLSPRTAGGP